MHQKRYQQHPINSKECSPGNEKSFFFTFSPSLCPLFCVKCFSRVEKLTMLRQRSTGSTTSDIIAWLQTQFTKVLLQTWRQSLLSLPPSLSVSVIILLHRIYWLSGKVVLFELISWRIQIQPNFYQVHVVHFDRRQYSRCLHFVVPWIVVVMSHVDYNTPKLQLVNLHTTIGCTKKRRKTNENVEKSFRALHFTTTNNIQIKCNMIPSFSCSFALASLRGWMFCKKNFQFFFFRVSSRVLAVRMIIITVKLYVNAHGISQVHQRRFLLEIIYFIDILSVVVVCIFFFCRYIDLRVADALTRSPNPTDEHTKKRRKKNPRIRYKKEELFIILMCGWIRCGTLVVEGVCVCAWAELQLTQCTNTKAAK